MMFRILLLVAFSVVLLSAQSTNWKISIVILGTTHTLDTMSSWNQYEANPLARSAIGIFSPAKGIALKTGIVVGTMLFQRYILKRHPKVSRAFAIQNYCIAGMIGGIAVRNWKVRE